MVGKREGVRKAHRTWHFICHFAVATLPHAPNESSLCFHGHPNTMQSAAVKSAVEKKKEDIVVSYIKK